MAEGLEEKRAESWQQELEKTIKQKNAEFHRSNLITER